MNLAQEIIKKYLFDLYKEETKNSNIIISFLIWTKKNNESLIKSSEDTQLVFDLGNNLINLMVQLKLVKVSLKVLSKEEKNKYFSSSS